MQTVSFGAFQFDFDKGLLLRGGEPINLGLRATRLLAALLSRPGEVLTKSELVEIGRDNAAIEESNLSVQVARLRGLLGPSPEGVDWIATVPRVGYRFAHARRRFQTSVLPALCVRPFIDLTLADERWGYRAAAITTDAVVALSRFKSFVLYAGDDQGPPPSIASCYLLKGAVRDQSDVLRVSAQLLDVNDGRCCWAENFDADIGSGRDGVDHLVARLVATVELQIELAEIAAATRRRPDAVSAYDLHLRGRYWLLSSHHEDNARATELFLKALEMEPENVAFLASACEALHHRISMGWPLSPGQVSLSHDLAVRGLRLTRDDSRAISLFGKALFFSGDPDLGFATCQCAAQINPNSVMSVMCAGQAHLNWGDLDEAERLFRQAYALNPLDHNHRFTMGSFAAIRLAHGRYEQALHAANRALALNRNYGPTNWALIAASTHLGRADEARQHVERYRSTQDGITLGRIAEATPAPDGRRSHILSGLERAGL